MWVQFICIIHNFLQLYMYLWTYDWYDDLSRKLNDMVRSGDGELSVLYIMYTFLHHWIASTQQPLGTKVEYLIIYILQMQIQHEGEPQC